MTSMDITIPAPAHPRSWSEIGAIAAVVTALVLALGGVVALGADAMRDGNGYFNWPTEPFTTSGYAIAMKTVDISKAPSWAIDAAADRVRVKAHSDRPIFIGIARTADVNRFLHGIEHDDISGLTYNPFQVEYDHTDGGRPERSPSSERFWVKATSGAGNVTLDWKPKPGSWRAIVMNADQSRRVNADLEFGVRTSLFWQLGTALLVASLVAAAAAVALFRRARA